MKLRTIGFTVSKNPEKVVAGLVEESRWFQAEPLPFGKWSITVKDEGVPMALRGPGISLDRTADEGGH